MCISHPVGRWLPANRRERTVTVAKPEPNHIWVWAFRKGQKSTAIKEKGVLQHYGKKKRKKESFVAQRNAKKLHTDNSLLDFWLNYLFITIHYIKIYYSRIQTIADQEHLKQILSWGNEQDVYSN